MSNAMITKKPAVPVDPAIAAERQRKQLEIAERVWSSKMNAIDMDYQATINAKPNSSEPVDPAHEARLNRIAQELIAFDVDWDEVEFDDFTSGNTPAPAAAQTQTAAAHTKASVSGAAAKPNATNGSGTANGTTTNDTKTGAAAAAAAAAAASGTADSRTARLRPDQSAFIKSVMSGLRIKPPPWAERVPDQAILDRVKSADTPPPSHLTANAPSAKPKKPVYLHAHKPAPPNPKPGTGSGNDGSTKPVASAAVLISKKSGKQPAVRIVNHTTAATGSGSAKTPSPAAAVHASTDPATAARAAGYAPLLIPTTADILAGANIRPPTSGHYDPIALAAEAEAAAAAAAAAAKQKEKESTATATATTPTTTVTIKSSHVRSSGGGRGASVSVLETSDLKAPVSPTGSKTVPVASGDDSSSSSHRHSGGGGAVATAVTTAIPSGIEPDTLD